MRILEFMSFDPSWFLTIPGLLITGGVVLLLIALIVFIATSKKGKGNANVDPTVEGSIPLVEGPNDGALANQPMGMDNMVNNMAVNNQSVGSMPEVNNTMNSMPQIPGSYMEMNQTPSVMPSMPDVNPAPVQVPNMDNSMGNAGSVVNMGTPVTQTNVVSSVAPTMPVNNQEAVPVMMNNQDMNQNSVIDFNSVANTPAQPAFDTAPSVEQPQVMNNNIYGGANPADINRPIYGGANPLENTSSIPTVTSHAAYNGEPIIPNSVVEEVKVAEAAPAPQINQGATVNSQQAAPITAESIFNSTPVTPSVEIQQPTPVVEQPQIMPQPSIESPTPVNNTNQNNTIETLDF